MTLPIIVSGVKLAVTGVPSVSRFQITPHAADTAEASSRSGGAVHRTRGKMDYMGTIRAWGHTPALPPNAKFTFLGQDRNGQGWQSSASGAIIDRAHIYCHGGRGQKRIYHDLHFLANGSLAKGTYTWAEDTAAVPSFPCPGLGISLDGGSTALGGVLGWELILDGNLTPPSWQSDSVTTTGTTNNIMVWPYREPGNLDATVIWYQRFGDISKLPQLNEYSTIWVQVTKGASPTYWKLKDCEVLQTPVIYEAAAEDGSHAQFVEAMQCTAKWTSYNEDTAAAGYIVNPAGSAIWGTAP